MNIDLKQSYDDCGPGPCEVSKEHYPSFHYDGPKELDLPDEGEMVIRFKKVSESTSKNGEKVWHSCTVDVLKIVSVTEDEPETQNSTKDTEDALDKLAKEKSSEKEDY